MGARPAPLAELAFVGEVIVWRGPAPYHFVPVPREHVAVLQQAARLASYGWGVVPVAVDVRGLPFRTSLFPRDGDYLVPLKAAIRRAAAITPGELIELRLRVDAPER